MTDAERVIRLREVLQRIQEMTVDGKGLEDAECIDDSEELGMAYVETAVAVYDAATAVLYETAVWHNDQG